MPSDFKHAKRSYTTTRFRVKSELLVHNFPSKDILLPLSPTPHPEPNPYFSSVLACHRGPHRIWIPFSIRGAKVTIQSWRHWSGIILERSATWRVLMESPSVQEIISQFLVSMIMTLHFFRKEICVDLRVRLISYVYLWRRVITKENIFRLQSESYLSNFAG